MEDNKFNFKIPLYEDNKINEEFKTKYIIKCKGLSVQSKRNFNELKFENTNFQSIIDQSKNDIKLSKAIASFIGSAVGDALGVHTEFSDVNYESIKLTDVNDNLIQVPNNQTTLSIVKLMELQQQKKRCQFGEFSDDTSMALCLADSLLYNKSFNPIDLRIRFILWWHFGYNNCRKEGKSFGLGGNISESLKDFYHTYENNLLEYFAENDIQNITNGNGSLMRNAAVPILFANCKDKDEMSENIKNCVEIAKNQSRTTHNGSEAYQCCMVLSYLIIKNINKIINSENNLKSGKDFLDEHLKYEDIKAYTGELDYSVQQLISSQIEDNDLVQKALTERRYMKEFTKDNKDRNWDWKDKNFRYSPTRAQKMPGYIGSYCMDALSMALHIVYTSTSNKESIFKSVFLGGDADTVACIVGQIAGSIWGLDEELLELYQLVSKFDNNKCAIIASLLYFKNK